MGEKSQHKHEQKDDLFWQLIRGYCSEYIAFEIFKELRKCGCITTFKMVRRNSFLDHAGVDLIVFAGGKKIPIQIKSSRPKRDEREQYLAQHIEVVIIGDSQLLTIVERINEALRNFNIRSIERQGVVKVCTAIIPELNIDRIRKQHIIRHIGVY